MSVVIMVDRHTAPAMLMRNGWRLGSYRNRVNTFDRRCKTPFSTYLETVLQ